MDLDRSRKTTFDGVAGLYDEVRPGYPEPLIEEMLALSGISREGRVLEVGCGPGKATLPVARRGYRMVCLELGENLARRAAHNLGGYPHVDVVNSNFEQPPLKPHSADLLFSAEAWHWIAPEIAYQTAARLLRPGGALALFWNQQPTPDTPFYRALQALYEEQAPPDLLIAHPDPDGMVAETVAAIDDSGLFGPVAVRRHLWTATYTAEQYVKLISTYSRYQVLQPAIRQRLLEAVFHLVQDFGGAVERPYRAMLYVAKKVE